jgi:hypothetical protein
MAKGKELTPRQQEIKALTEQGKNGRPDREEAGHQRQRGVPAPPRDPGRREEVQRLHQPVQRSRATADGSRRVAHYPDGRSRPAPTPAAPATAEELLRQEIDGAQAGVSDLKGQIKGHQDEIARAEKEIEALTAEIDRKGDVLAVLTGKKVARDKPKPTAAKPPSAPLARRRRPGSPAPGRARRPPAARRRPHRPRRTAARHRRPHRPPGRARGDRRPRRSGTRRAGARGRARHGLAPTAVHRTGVVVHGRGGPRFVVDSRDRRTPRESSLGFGGR